LAWREKKTKLNRGAGAAKTHVIIADGLSRVIHRRIVISTINTLRPPLLISLPVNRSTFWTNILLLVCSDISINPFRDCSTTLEYPSLGACFGGNRNRYLGELLFARATTSYVETAGDSSFPHVDHLRQHPFRAHTPVQGLDYKFEISRPIPPDGKKSHQMIY
jgi:hypothetical protein